MGYNLSRGAIERNRPQLDQLISLKSTMRFNTESPHRLAYKLREAIASCGIFEEFSKDFTVLSHYTFSAERAAVLATFNEIPIGIPVGPDVDEDFGELDERIEVERVERNVIEAISLIDILSEVVANKKTEEIHFPNAALNLGDRTKLFYWTEKNSWSYIDHQEKGLTLTRYEVDREILWRPESETALQKYD